MKSIATAKRAAAPRESLKALETLMRRGCGLEVQERLLRLAAGAVPRAQLAEAARLAWRAGRPEWGLRWLRPLVRPAAREPGEATTEEIAEYAQCLVRLGGALEAGELLEPLDADEVPRVSLYRAAVHCSRWDYAAALPFFERFVEKTRARSYEQLLGRTNLAAALVHERRYPAATALLRSLLHETNLRRLPLLHANALHVYAIACIDRRRWAEAERCLDRATVLLARSTTLDPFLVEKWRTLLAWRRRPDAEAHRALGRLRARAEERRHWETVRECDRYEALERRDEALLQHLYLGTIHERYREALLADWNAPFTAPSPYRWAPAGIARGAPEADAGEGRSGRAALPPGKLEHRLLLALCSDFYRPFPLPLLFQKLFPDENYNPLSAPKRVHQAIGLLRRWLEGAGLPIGVVEDGRQYRLSAQSPCTILVPVQREGQSRYSLRLGQLATRFGGGAFSAAEAAAHLEVSPRSALRILDGGMREGRLVREGTGRATLRYRFR